MTNTMSYKDHTDSMTRLRRDRLNSRSGEQNREFCQIGRRLIAATGHPALLFRASVRREKSEKKCSSFT